MMLEGKHGFRTHAAACGALALLLGTAGSAHAATAAGAPGAGAAAAVRPPAAGYQIHPGDQLNVTVYGEPTLTQKVTVLADSTIAYPMIGKVSLANQTPEQASLTLTSAFSKYLKHPMVSVAVEQEGQVTVMVLGNVKQPGKYQLPFKSHVTDAIAAAGGMGPTNGDLPVARVSDAAGTKDEPLQAVLRGGDLTKDVPLDQNAVVYVPSPATFNVQVIGAVDHPGQVELSEGDRLTAAIAKAGNSSAANADLNNIKVTRIGPDGQAKQFSINLYNQLQKGDLASDISLQKNDVVFVPQAKKSGQNMGGTIFGILGRVFGFGW